MSVRLAFLLCALIFLTPVGAKEGGSYPSFQALVDATPENGVLRPEPGTYAGPVVVSKPMTIDGGGKVTIDGGGVGTVFTIQTSDAQVRGLKIIGSGDSHDAEDTGIRVGGDRNVVEKNDIDDCLFGIDLKQANKNIIRGNNIRSKNVDLGVRGDAIRLWYSMENEVVQNHITHSRDTVVWYSNGNRIAENYSAGNRYSVHFMFAETNLVEDNYFYDNAVGVYLMYTKGVTVRNNVISHSTGATGLGIGFKEASDAVIEGNEVIYCATAIAFDISPFEPGSKIMIDKNRLAYNGVGLNFLSDREGTFVTGNIFEGNITQVMSASTADEHSGTIWKGNYWDTYQGFDRDANGTGDTPFEVYTYFDQIWNEIPEARFFKNTPFLEIVDFLERLAPFSSPDLLLRDPEPLFDRPQYTVNKVSLNRAKELAHDDRKKDARN